jgi:riboflavin biosynthesis pyrimidine reductase
MVGKGRVTSAFLKTGVVDRVVITVAPLLLGG